MGSAMDGAREGVDLGESAASARVGEDTPCVVDMLIANNQGRDSDVIVKVV